MSKPISAEFLASMRAQFPNADADAAASWIATLADIDNPESMLSALLSKGKFAKGGAAQPRGAQVAGPRGTLAQDGGWDRRASHASRHESAALDVAESVAQRCPSPAAAVAYLAGEVELLHMYQSALALWATLDTPVGWHCAPVSNTAQAWVKAACIARIAPPAESPPADAGAEGLLLRDWIKA